MTQSDNRDLHCVKRVLRGDNNAFSEIVERHQDAVIRIVWQLSSDFHQAEDIAQDAFVRAHEHLGKFDPEKGVFSNWLYAIAVNLGRNAHRKIRAFPNHFLEISEDEEKETPSLTLERREQFERLNEALDQLSEPFRSSFILAEIEEIPLSDIAQIESVPIGTIKSRINRAKNKLRNILILNHES